MIRKIICLLFFICLANLSKAQFVHPGMLHTQEDLDFIREKVNQKEEPWKSAFAELEKSELANLDWEEQPYQEVEVGYYSRPNIGASEMRADGDAAYTMALLWSISKEVAYAEKAIEILNAWSYKLDSVTNDNRKWHLGTVGIKYLNAAEIIKHTYDGWEEKDIKSFENMILNVWFPVIESFQPNFNGNWDAAIIQTMMSIGVFLDRQDIFDLAYNQSLHGYSHGAINHYYNEFGQCQESGRDQGHAQIGLGFMSAVCEIAWNQGKDLYAAYDNRLALGFEYTAKYMIGEEVKYVPYKAYDGEIVFPDGISSQDRGNFFPVYERGYRHYHGRLGMEMPYTKLALEQSKPEFTGGNIMPWSSLVNSK